MKNTCKNLTPLTAEAAGSFPSSPEKRTTIEAETTTKSVSLHKLDLAFKKYSDLPIIQIGFLMNFIRPQNP